ncbi:MAG: phosphoenolpyruvate synthase, partial [Deltaproteobacteria bacterium]|nr:phosphoenolpyruvate synthase [Deltaproteobacteria bacterium]
MGVVQSSQAFEAGEERVGGKAIGLARLTNAQAPVPPWFVVATEAFHHHLKSNNIGDVIQKSLDVVKALDIKDPISLRTIGEQAEIIQAAIKDAPLDGALLDEITGSVKTLGDSELAVRSSMVGEDSAEHSFAGQLDSFLFQKTPEDVSRSLRACWASAFGDRSIAYHMRAGLPLDNMRVGVVVQRMIDGDVSGVMFTANPSNGRRDESLLTAAWGQGEGIVSGLCNTDEFVWEHTGKELSAQLVDKDIKVARTPDGSPGTVELEVDEAQRNVRCLDESLVNKICAEGLRVAENFGSAQDIEWTMEKGELYFVQSRPITSLPLPENKEGPLVVWDNSNIQESYCGVTTPMTFTFANRAYTLVYKQVLEVFGLPKPVIDEFEPNLRNMLGIVKGRIYYNINNWYRYLLIALPGFGTNKADMEKMMGLTDPVDLVEDQVLTTGEKIKRLPMIFRALWRLKSGYRDLPRSVPYFLNYFQNFYNKMDRKSFETASFSKLMELIDSLRTECLVHWHTPIINDFYVMQTNGKLARMLEKAGYDEPTAMQNSLISGEEGIESTEPTRFLMRMAKEARLNDAIGKLCIEGDPLTCIANLKESFPEYGAKIDDYVERYGDRTMGELKLETISLREDPSFVIEVIRNFIDRPDIDPDKLAANEKDLRYK